MLATETFGLVLVSPRRRARETCEIAGLGGQAIVEPDLAEWDYGQYEGLTGKQIRRLSPNWLIFRDGCPGGETPDQVGARVDRVIARVRAVEGNAVVFAHGHLLRVLGARWLGLPARRQHFLLDTATLGMLGYYHEIPAEDLERSSGREKPPIPGDPAGAEPRSEGRPLYVEGTGRWKRLSGFDDDFQRMLAACRRCRRARGSRKLEAVGDQALGIDLPAWTVFAAWRADRIHQPVVMVIFRPRAAPDEGRPAPCTPTLAIVPPAPMPQVMKEAGTPTASMAVSTPRPPVIFITASAALPSLAHRRCRRSAAHIRTVSPKSIMMISAGDRTVRSAARQADGTGADVATALPGATLPLSTPHSKPVGARSTSPAPLRRRPRESGRGSYRHGGCGHIRPECRRSHCRIQPPVVQWEIPGGSTRIAAG
jgi:probable phosphoglycerate mutase